MENSKTSVEKDREKLKDLLKKSIELSKNLGINYLYHTDADNEEDLKMIDGILNEINSLPRRVLRNIRN